MPTSLIYPKKGRIKKGQPPDLRPNFQFQGGSKFFWALDHQDSWNSSIKEPYGFSTQTPNWENSELNPEVNPKRVLNWDPTKFCQGKQKDWQNPIPRLDFRPDWGENGWSNNNGIRIVSYGWQKNQDYCKSMNAMGLHSDSVTLTSALYNNIPIFLDRYWQCGEELSSG